MIEKIISFSIKNKLIIFIGVLFLIVSGIYSMLQIPLDAVPDITNNQVQVVTNSPSLAPEEVEKLITYPLEIAFANIPNMVEIRSISKYGLSVITVVFEEDLPIMTARQYINEQISSVSDKIPKELGTPTLMPITTGLGEIYQYTLEVEDEYKGKYSLLELRDVQDWIVKRELSGTNGVIEVSSFGGYLKEYEISIDNDKLKSFNLSLAEVFNSVEQNTENSGAGYIEKNTDVYYIRLEGLASEFEEIKNIRVKTIDGYPVLLRDIAEITFGSPKRFGAMTKDGNGEVVGGIALMLKGANSYQTINNIKEKVKEINKSLPKGIYVKPYLERTFLIDSTISTVSKNLIEGGLIVVFILVLLLGNYRGGIIVASVIPLSMLFALVFMNLFGVSANLMSLGAIDFGIIIDGAVIIVEGILSTFHNSKYHGVISKETKENVILESSTRIYKSAFFGVIIILTVFFPILSLKGIEGKMFQPMALTLIFAISGSLILSITYVPMIASLFLSNKISHKENFSDKIMNFITKLYSYSLNLAFKLKILVVSSSILVLLSSFWLFSNMGGEFLPQLEEGDLAMQLALTPGSSLSQTIEKSTQIENTLLKEFPEVKSVVSKIGTAEVPTDPMSIETGDIMILLKEKKDWVSAKTKEELVNKMIASLEKVHDAKIEFSQPIQLRFNELMTGSKADVAIQVFGDNLKELKDIADNIVDLISGVEGAEDIKAEVTDGLKIMNITFDRENISRLNVDIKEINNTLKTLYLGSKVAYTIENDRTYDLVIRSSLKDDKNINLDEIFVKSNEEKLYPVSMFAKIEYIEAPMLISREQTKRRINVGLNVRGRDTESVIKDIQEILNKGLNLPAGYSIKYGGQFENMESARNRLYIALPIALAIIFLFLYLAFNSVKNSLIIFTAIPFSAIGGILSLYVRDMPFSISAGIGFIALFGISVLNGIVLISYFEENKNNYNNIQNLIFEGAKSRLRPVIMTALVAALGFLPMAISTGLGAEVQKPLATVVIGGLITSTLLTLILLPIIYFYFYKKRNVNVSMLTVMLVLFISNYTYSQEVLTLEEAVNLGIEKSIELKNSKLNIEFNEENKRNLNPLSTLNIQSNIMDKNSETELQMIQNFNSFFTLFKQKEINDNNIINAKILLEMNEKEIKNTIIDLYLLWQNLYVKKNIYDSLIINNMDLMEKSSIKLNNGDISIIDYGLIEANNIKLISERNDVYKDYYNIINELFSIIQIDYEGVNPDINININLNNSENINNLFYAELNNKIEGQELLSKYYKLNNLPSFGIGYMGRMFPDGVNSNGVAVSISIPLFNAQNTIQQNQAEITKEIFSNNYRLEKIKLENELRQLKNTLYELEKQKINYNSDDIIKKLNLSIETGNISYLEYYQMLSAIKEAIIASEKMKYEILLLKNKINYLTN